MIGRHQLYLCEGDMDISYTYVRGTYTNDRGTSMSFINISKLINMCPIQTDV